MPAAPGLWALSKTRLPASRELLLLDDHQGLLGHHWVDFFQVSVLQGNAALGPVFAAQVSQRVLSAMDANVAADLGIRRQTPGFLGPGELQPVLGVGIVQPDEV